MNQEADRDEENESKGGVRCLVKRQTRKRVVGRDASCLPWPHSVPWLLGSLQSDSWSTASPRLSPLPTPGGQMQAGWRSSGVILVQQVSQHGEKVSSHCISCVCVLQRQRREPASQLLG